MELTNARTLAAPIDAVWQALNDPAVLQACIPGCETFERTGDDGYRMTMSARVGPVSAQFTGRMTVTDAVPPERYTLRFEGQGGAAGFANGTANVNLTSPLPGTTTLTYFVKAQIGGKLAQIGSRLVDGAAAKLADDFFARFVAHVAPHAATVADERVREEAAAPTPAAVRSRDGQRTWTRYIAIAAMLCILAWLFTKRGQF
jgi:carbon monoxide dehydrogenase subunit G